MEGQSERDERREASNKELYERIRAEARETISRKAKPIDVEALRRSMEIPEPDFLGNLGNRKGFSTETYSIQETARRLNLSKKQVHTLISDGRLRPIEVGQKQLRIFDSEVERYKECRRQEKIASLRKIAQACEELGMYEDGPTNQNVE